jgi:L-alanine-DL-glutamate epimerase-like enolase superfamily enzyme
MTPRLDAITTVQPHPPAHPGDDSVFVAARSGSTFGWYGPVGTGIGQLVGTVAAAVVGCPVTDHHRVQQLLLRRAQGRSGRWAAGAVDCAVWDLHGRLAGAPVAALLAPAQSLAAVPAYASWLRQDLRDASTYDLVAKVAEEGWAFTKWGLRAPAGCSSDSAIGQLVDAAARAAAAFDGIGVGFAADAVGTWTAHISAGFAERVEAPCLMWLEDPLPEHAPAYRHLTAGGLPVAIGERLLPGEDVARLLATVRPAAFTVDVAGCGGLTRALELTAIARRAGIPVYPHGRSLAPGIHLAAAFPQAVPAVEYRLQWEPVRQRLCRTPVTPTHGTLPPPAEAGLGTQPRSPR